MIGNQTAAIEPASALLWQVVKVCDGCCRTRISFAMKVTSMKGHKQPWGTALKSLMPI
jgi:hypothetical protein